MDLIERNKVIEVAMQYCPDDDGTCSKADKDIRELLDELEAIPAADVVPVIHGKWERHMSFGICDKCRYEYDWKATDARNFCPNCGAKMDGEE